MEKQPAARRDISLIFTDFDGTLAVGGSILPVNAQAVRDFLESGQEKYVVNASARSPGSLREKMDQAALPDFGGRLMFSGFNGALSYFGHDIMQDIPIDPCAVDELARRAVAINTNGFFFGKDRIFAIRQDEVSREYSQKLSYRLETGLPQQLGATYLAEIAKPAGMSDQVFRAIVNLPGGNITTHIFNPRFVSKENPDTRWFHILPSCAGKRQALGIYLDRLNIPTERVMVLGDDVNDIEMLMTPSVLPVTFADAIEQNRRIPGIHIAPAAKEGGFAYALRHYI